MTATTTDPVDETITQLHRMPDRWILISEHNSFAHSWGLTHTQVKELEQRTRLQPGRTDIRTTSHGGHHNHTTRTTARWTPPTT